MIKRSLDDLAVFGGSPHFSEPLHVGRPNVGNRERLFQRLNDLLDRRWLTNDGKYVREFEARLAERLGVKQARVEAFRLGWGPLIPALNGNPDQRPARMKQAWERLPLYVRPALYFGYRYFVRLGFLDGKQGFLFHFLHRFWYRLLVDVYLEELRRKGAPVPAREAVGVRQS